MAGFEQYEFEELKKLEPKGYQEYMANYGEHFSKAMCQWAVSMMKDRTGKPLVPWDKSKTDDVLNRFGIHIDNDKGYDKVFVINMGRADYMGSSIIDEAHLALYVKDVLDDPDGYESIAFNRFLMDCRGKGIPIEWSDML